MEESMECSRVSDEPEYCRRNETKLYFKQEI